jgi:hypothetical protein
MSQPIIMKLILIAVTVLIATTHSEYNPGIIVNIHESEFGSLVANMLPVINKMTKKFEVDEEIEDGSITIHKMIVSLDDLEPEQLQFDFKTHPGVILIKLTNVNHSIISFADFNMKIFKSTGTIISSGIINVIMLRMYFRDFDDSHKDKPYFSIKIDDLQFNKDSFVIKADFKLIPDWAIDSIIKLFKSSVLDKVKTKILKRIDRDGDGMIDKAINKDYPSSVSLEQLDTSMSTNLVRKPISDDQNLYFYIDGTFFNTEKGYSRSSDAENITIHTDDQFFIDVHVTQYSINSLFSALNGNVLKYDFFGFWLFFDSLSASNPISIIEDKITIKDFSSQIGAEKGADYFARLKSSIELESNLITKKIGKDFWAFIDILNFELLDLQIDASFPTARIPIQLIRDFTKMILTFKNEFKFKFPKMKLPFEVQLKDIGLSLFKEHMRIGLSIERDV